MGAVFLLVGLGFVCTALLSYLISVFTRDKEHVAFRVSRIGSLAITGLGLFFGLVGTLCASDDGADVMIFGMILLLTGAGSWFATLMFWLGRPPRAGSQREEIGLSPHL